MKANQKPQPWEQQPGESSRAFSAFRAWLDQSPGSGRPILAAYRTFSGRPEAKKPPGYFRTWIENFHWPARAQEYDRYLFRVEQQARIEALRQQQMKWAERKEQVLEEDFQDAAKLRQRVKEILALPLVKQTLTNTQVSEDGMTILNTYEVQPINVRAADAGTLLKLASDIQRIALGMATSIVEAVDPQQQANKRLDEARRCVEESHERFPDLDEEDRIRQIAAAFGVSLKDLAGSDDD